jgi:hypothetical protein
VKRHGYQVQIIAILSLAFSTAIWTSRGWVFAVALVFTALASFWAGRAWPG